MKKILFMFSIFVVCLSFNKVEADTITLSGDTEFTSETFTINVNVSSAKTIEAALFPLNYDSNKITLDKTLSIGQNGFKMSVDKNIVFDENSKTGNFVIGKIVFKATDNFKIGDSTTITLGDGKFSDDTNETTVKGTSITIKRIAESSSIQNCQNVEKEFNLIYNTNGGNVIATELVKETNNEELPTPTKEGYIFKGWYKNSSLTTAVSSNKKIDLLTAITTDNCINGYKDVTLYAKWENEIKQVDTGNGMPILILPLAIVGVLSMKKLKDKKKIFKL